jgi:hypothetical protein
MPVVLCERQLAHGMRLIGIALKDEEYRSLRRHQDNWVYPDHLSRPLFLPVSIALDQARRQASEPLSLHAGTVLRWEDYCPSRSDE